ncbi:hypothetical protein SISSUDRAFT_1051402 [Sistotremastrum suecicum HHB10207 ss-3]|uniref:Uncharacterized protein n=1 Tax=Sistotremastrum suecicum HHB10207 ss-3 TaxID=1314776 RepID=A0A166ALC8_9AGAM|nr:hypothetical protein SISSUDRAFT_1051402 [Sistotremastrum suecicum HHB10207 ss-3]
MWLDSVPYLRVLYPGLRLTNKYEGVVQNLKKAKAISSLFLAVTTVVESRSTCSASRQHRSPCTETRLSLHRKGYVPSDTAIGFCRCCGSGAHVSGFGRIPSDVRRSSIKFLCRERGLRLFDALANGTRLSLLIDSVLVARSSGASGFSTLVLLLA